MADKLYHRRVPFSLSTVLLSTRSSPKGSSMEPPETPSRSTSGPGGFSQIKSYIISSILMNRLGIIGTSYIPTAFH